MDHEDLSAALDAAQWKEIVTVETQTKTSSSDTQEDKGDGGGTTADDRGGPSSVVNLVASLDTQHGGLQWNPIPNEQVVARYLEAKQWILPMLNDQRRNQLYATALEQVITQKANQCQTSENPLHLLDLGCGTGLLGQLAARACAMTTTTNIPLHVTAVDMSPVMTHLAEHTWADNTHIWKARKGDAGGVVAEAGAASTSGTMTPASTTTVRVVSGHSTELPALRQAKDKGGAHVCVSELLEDGLLGEGWLPAVRDAWARHMAVPKVDDLASSQVRMIPAGATVWAQLVTDRTDDKGDGAWLAKYTHQPRPFVTQSGDTLHWIPRSTAPETSQTTATAAVLPLHVEHLFQNHRMGALSEPVNILELDVSHPERVPGPAGGRTERTVVASVDGTIHGILVGWSLQLSTADHVYHLCSPLTGANGNNEHDDKDNDNTVSSDSRTKTITQDHWHPCLHVLDPPLSTDKGQSWTLHTQHDDYHIEVSLSRTRTSEETLQPTSPPAAKRAKESTPEHDSKGGDDIERSALLLSSRIFQLNETSRLRLLEQGIYEALRSLPEPAIVLDISDFCVGALLAASAMSDGKRGCPIFSLERLQTNLAALSIQASHMTNRVCLWQGHLEHITLESLASTTTRPNDDTNTTTTMDLLVVAEPFYPQLHYWPHLEAFQLYYAVRGLRQRLVAPPTTTPGSVSWRIHSVPRRARLWAAALWAPELAQAYGPCDTLQSTFGLDHSYVLREHFGPEGVRELSLLLWQYDYQLLTAPVQVGILAYNDENDATMNADGAKVLLSSRNNIGVEKSASGKRVETPFVIAGTCHGVVVWVSYDYEKEQPSHWSNSNHPSVLGSRQLVHIWQHPVEVAKSTKDATSFWGKVQVDQPELPRLRFGVGKVVEAFSTATICSHK